MNPETLKTLILDLLDGCISEADLQALEAELSSILTADEARSINPSGRLETISIKPSAFLTEIPGSLPYLYWSFDKKDGLQASGNHPALSDRSTT